MYFPKCVAESSKKSELIILQVYQTSFFLIFTFSTPPSLQAYSLQASSILFLPKCMPMADWGFMIFFL